MQGSVPGGGSDVTRELLAGLRRFRKDHFPRYEERFRRLVDEGQRPSTLFIGCSDSRVVPEVLTDAAPGDLFVVRNVGNMVPPHERTDAHHGVSAAIEYAAEVLRVRDVVVCGHSHCGAIRALYESDARLPENLRRWLRLAAPARLDEGPSEAVLRRTERRSVLLQLDRLMDHPGIRERVEAGAMALHGWHYSIEGGVVEVFDPAAGEFVPP